MDDAARDLVELMRLSRNIVSGVASARNADGTANITSADHSKSVRAIVSADWVAGPAVAFYDQSAQRWYGVSGVQQGLVEDRTILQERHVPSLEGSKNKIAFTFVVSGPPYESRWQSDRHTSSNAQICYKAPPPAPEVGTWGHASEWPGGARVQFNPQHPNEIILYPGEDTLGGPHYSKEAAAQFGEARESAEWVDAGSGWTLSTNPCEYRKNGTWVWPRDPKPTGMSDSSMPNGNAYTVSKSFLWLGPGCPHPGFPDDLWTWSDNGWQRYFPGHIYGRRFGDGPEVFFMFSVSTSGGCNFIPGEPGPTNETRIAIFEGTYYEYVFTTSVTLGGSWPAREPQAYPIGSGGLEDPPGPAPWRPLRTLDTRTIKSVFINLNEKDIHLMDTWDDDVDVESCYSNDGRYLMTVVKVSPNRVSDLGAENPGALQFGASTVYLFRDGVSVGEFSRGSPTASPITPFGEATDDLPLSAVWKPWFYTYWTRDSLLSLVQDSDYLALGPSGARRGLSALQSSPKGYFAQHYEWSDEPTVIEALQWLCPQKHWDSMQDQTILNSLKFVAQVVQPGAPNVFAVSLVEVFRDKIYKLNPRDYEFDGVGKLKNQDLVIEGKSYREKVLQTLRVPDYLINEDSSPVVAQVTYSMPVEPTSITKSRAEMFSVELCNVSCWIGAT